MVKYKINKFCFVKNQVCLAILLILGFSFLVYLFPFNAVNAAKFQSGVTIKAPTTNETAPITNEICNNGIDDNGNGAIDEVTCLPPPAGTCGLQVVSGVPINYGQLNLDQESAEQKVTIKNEGTSQTPAKIMIKGGDWVSDAAGNPTIFPSMNTHVAIAPNLDWGTKKPLSSAGWELGGISGGQSLPVYFQMKPGGATLASLNSSYWIASPRRYD